MADNKSIYDVYFEAGASEGEYVKHNGVLYKKVLDKA